MLEDSGELGEALGNQGEFEICDVIQLRQVKNREPHVKELRIALKRLITMSVKPRNQIQHCRCTESPALSVVFGMV